MAKLSRNHTNYFFGKFSIEPMSAIGLKKTYTVFAGTLCEVYEKITYKTKGSYHWLALGFDDDGMGPTKHLFFNIRKENQIFWLFQMCVHNFFLNKGDEIAIEYSGKVVTMIVNGEKVPEERASRTSPRYKELNKDWRLDSIDKVLRMVCSWALPTYVRDEVEEEAVYRCQEFICNFVREASNKELRTIIKKLFIHRLENGLTFKEIHSELITFNWHDDFFLENSSKEEERRDENHLEDNVEDDDGGRRGEEFSLNEFEESR